MANFEQKRIGARLVPPSVPSIHLRIAQIGWHAKVCTRHHCNRCWSKFCLERKRKKDDALEETLLIRCCELP